jgi:murein DD-endopeptidase MepM/ murein hydrolase activator NlpD
MVGMVGKGFTTGDVSSTSIVGNPFILGRQQVTPVVLPVMPLATKVSVVETEETPFPFVQNAMPFKQQIIQQPVVGIVTRALNQHHPPIAFGTLPPPKTAKQNEKFLRQLNSTLKTIHRNNLPVQKRKQVFIALLGIVLTGGFVASAGQLLMPTTVQTTSQTTQRGLLPDLSANAANVVKATTTTTTADVIVTSLDPIPELDQPPDSAVDDTLSFPEPTEPTVNSSVAIKKRIPSNIVTPAKHSDTLSAHVVDLFEDTTPVPTLELPAQKKPQTVKQALANLPSYTPKQAALIEELLGNGGHHSVAKPAKHSATHPWWKPRNGFNLKNPLSHMSISSHFGSRWGRMHRGIDLQAPHGVNIYAANGGRVVYAGWESGYGNLVIVDHGNGVRTKYAHCSKLTVAVGDVVEQGQRIAKVGSTGHSTGPHLHFEVVVNGKTRNPIAYL